MDTHRSLIGTTLFVAALGSHAQSSLPSTASQQLHTSAGVTIERPDPWVTYRDDQGQYRAHAPATDQLHNDASTADPITGESWASSASDVGFGWMRSNAGGSASTTPPPDSTAVHRQVSLNSSADEAFSDTLTINAAGLTGRSGLAHAKVLVSSNVTRTLGGPAIGEAAREAIDARAYFVLDRSDWIQGTSESGVTSWAKGTSNGVMVYGATPTSSFYEAYDPHSNVPLSRYDGGPSGGWLSIDVVIPFTFGTTFNIDAYGGASTSIGLGVPQLPPDDPLYAFKRYGQSDATLNMRWGGIDSVELDTVDGFRTLSMQAANLPIEFSVSSGSGVDYSRAVNAVPEPQTWALLLMGLASLGCLRRRA